MTTATETKLAPRRSLGRSARTAAPGIRILVAEENQLFLDATVHMFGMIRDFEVVHTVLAPEAVVDEVRPTRALVDRAVATGVLSVIPTHAPLRHLVDVVRGVAGGFLTLGLPIKDIASKLFLAPGTMRNLTSSLIKRLGARNRFDAVRIARERGWL